MPLNALIIFLSSFLLFQIQPIIGKLILPVFGGASAVWTTCMLFFQLMLLLGYSYAHLNITRFSGKRGAVIHIGLIVGALLALFLVDAPTALSGLPPAVQILIYLSIAIGLPYLTLSATAPLVQGILAREIHDNSIYRLYAVSNAASFLALLSYPVLVEPVLSVSTQLALWRSGFVLFALLLSWRLLHASEAPATAATPQASGQASAVDRLLWFLLPFCSASMLLALTNQLCQNVASVPLLWIAPLALYLLSWVFTFNRAAPVNTTVWGVMFVALLSVLLAVLAQNAVPPLVFLVPVILALLFAICMFCHGELSRRKPEVDELTSFYLVSSLGSVVGSAYVGIAAPLLYLQLSEIIFAYGLCIVLVVLLTLPRMTPLPGKTQILLSSRVLFPLLSVSIAVLLVSASIVDSARRSIANSRNFYGALRVSERNPDVPNYHYYRLHHGAVVHGMQFQSKEKRLWPTAYYGENSGVGLALTRTPSPGGRKIAGIGLGVGTIAAYGQPSDHFRFYEIDPAVADFARTYFSFLEDGAAPYEIILGDARLSLAAEQDTRYDIIVVDAFSGDSVPAHLLTVEALDMYLARLAPAGILAFHISNLYLDLEPVVAALAKARGLEARYVEDPGVTVRGQSQSMYMLLAREASALEFLREAGRVANDRGVKPWTDDFSNLFQVIKR